MGRLLQALKELISTNSSLWLISVVLLILSSSAYSAPSNGDDDDNGKNHIDAKKQVQEAIKALNVGGAGNELKAVTIQDLLSWEPILSKWEVPYNLSRRFPAYQTGYDYENRPIWVTEFGRWDVKSVAEGSPEESQAFERYFALMLLSIIKSMSDRSTPDNPVTEASIILDYDGAKIDQALSIPTVQLWWKLTRKYRDVLVEHAGDIALINVNAVAQIAIDLTRPFFAVLDDRMETFGTNPTKWKPALRKKFPLESIPTWYGGKKDYKPVRILGMQT